MSGLTFDDATVEHVGRGLREGRCDHFDERGEHGCADSTEHFARVALASLATAPGWGIDWGRECPDSSVLLYTAPLDGTLPDHRARLVGPWQEVQP